MELSVEELNNIFEYRDGELIWKARSSKCVKIGDIVSGVGGNGYKRVTINYKSYLAHRIIYFMHNGFVAEYLDHINGNKLDNRIENLRACTVSENGQNAKLRTDNSSGIKGVSWLKIERRWRARIESKGKVIATKYFLKKEDAKEYIENIRANIHGEFARNN